MRCRVSATRAIAGVDSAPFRPEIAVTLVGGRDRRPGHPRERRAAIPVPVSFTLALGGELRSMCPREALVVFLTLGCVRMSPKRKLLLAGSIDFGWAGAEATTA